jgi:hypothetical protein
VDGKGPYGGSPSKHWAGVRPHFSSIPSPMRRLSAGWNGDLPTRRCVVVLPKRASSGCAVSHGTRWHNESAGSSTTASARRG